MKRTSTIILPSLVALAPIVLMNWTCSAYGRQNYDKDKICRWYRALH